MAELSTNHRGPHGGGGGGGGGAEINLLVPQKSKICFPGFHVPQNFLCLLVPLKSCTYLLCSLEINAPGGGGVTLVFSAYIGSDPASTVHPK